MRNEMPQNSRWCRMALENALPILGICRVHQLLNIALGGTLYQDLAMQLPDTLDHAYAPATPWNTTYTL